MTNLKSLSAWFIDSGIQADTPDSDIKYLRFLNATLLLFGLAQAPVAILLATLQLWTQLVVNLVATGLCGYGFWLNRRGRYLSAKTLVLAVLITNTAYFAVIMGSSTPTHFWLIPMAVLSALVFKASERLYTAAFVGFSVLCFVVLEIVYRDLTPIVRPVANPIEAQWAAQGSTVSAILLTLALVAMMHRRFADSEIELSEQKVQSDRLLRAILPEEVAKELRTTGRTKAVRHEDVSILFADLVGFTPLAASMPAENVVAFLAEVFTQIDQLIAECGVEKIKTIGDAYMVAGGVPQSVPDHAERLARCAFGMLDIIDAVSAQWGHPLQIRLGMHRGSVVAGVIGTTKFAYDLWGESVNLAARLESSGEPGRIHVSNEFKTSLHGVLSFEERGEITLKGVGQTRTYWLVQRDRS
ncbi:MAG: guanylate cyclase [Myxococcales bacterium]|nr:guanylate cyclase [Myxococcales bacterium]